MNSQNPRTSFRSSPSLLLFRAALTVALLLGCSQALSAQPTVRSLTEPRLPRFEYLSRLTGQLLIPVEGFTAERLRDSYAEGRSGGRVHEAIDIHAPRGTPVIAVADGTILKLYQKGKGGNSIAHLDPDGRTRYYYAHLDRYAEGLREGMKVRRGQVIGYVGDTGNARKGDYHLHFSIALLSDRSRWWEGESINPYLILKAAPRNP
jgi:peptidoglycan LD-endopeptidase LytH